MNGERNNALRAALAREVLQVDPEFNPDQVMGPGDQVPRKATALEREMLGIKSVSPPDLCVCGTMTRAEHGCLCAPENESYATVGPMPPPDKEARTFDTGATRDTEKGKLDYEAFLSPLVLERFAQYMDKHRVQSDGTLRPGDNWQKGIPDDAYMKSLCRHFIDVWKAHRAGGEMMTSHMEEALCAVMFNAMGLLYELVRLR